MKFLKVFFLFLATCNVFSYNILSKEEELFALKYYSQEEINKIDEWIFNLSFSMNIIENGKPFKMPNVKFYDNEKLTGAAFAFIDEKGLNVYGEYACIRKTHDGESEYIVDPKNIRIDKYHMSVGDKIVPAQREIIDGGVLCPYIPLEKWGTRDNETLDINFRVSVIDERIGKFKMGGQDVYFDIVEWSKKYMVEKSPIAILKKNLTTKDLEDIGDLLLGLRKVLEKGSMQDVYNYITKKDPTADPKSDKYNSLFASMKTEVALSRSLSSPERERAIKSTVITSRKVSVRNAPFMSKTGGKDIDVFFGRGGGNVSFDLERRNNIWSISYFDIFGEDTDPSGD